MSKSLKKSESEKSLLGKYQNGGKLVPKYQSGNLLGGLDLNQILNIDTSAFPGDKSNASTPNLGGYYGNVEGVNPGSQPTMRQPHQPEGGFTGVGNYSGGNTESTLESKYTDSFLEDKNRKRGSIFSPTGVNVGGAEIQYNDIAQFILALKAKNNKVAEVTPYQEEYQSRGSRNVRSVSGIDSNIRNRAEEGIASIGGSGYQGSDPIMNMISNRNISDAKRQAKAEYLSKEVDHLSREESRYAAEMEQKRSQVADDLVESNRVKNANAERIFKANMMAAQAETDKESQFSKNLATISSNVQGRMNARANQNRAIKAQEEQAAYAAQQERRRQDGIAYRQAKHDHDVATNERLRSDYTQGWNDTQIREERKRYDQAFYEENKDLIDRYNSYDSPGNEYESKGRNNKIGFFNRRKNK